MFLADSRLTTPCSRIAVTASNSFEGGGAFVLRIDEGAIRSDYTSDWLMPDDDHVKRIRTKIPTVPVHRLVGSALTSRCARSGSTAARVSIASTTGGLHAIQWESKQAVGCSDHCLPVSAAMRSTWCCIVLVLSCASWASAQTRVAVMPFRGIAVSQADSPLVDGLADMLATNLAESQGIQVLERTQIKGALDALKVDASVIIDRATAVKIGSWLGATHVIVGTVAALGEQVRMDSRVVSLTAGVIENSARAEGSGRNSSP